MADRIPGAITASFENPLNAASDTFGGLTAILDEALNQFRARQYEEASTCLAKLLTKSQALLAAAPPGSVDVTRLSVVRACALTLDGRCAEERGMQECARERFAQAVTIFDESLPKANRSGDGAMPFANWAAVIFGGSARKGLPGDLLSYYGVALRMVNRRPEAISALRQVVEMNAATRETYRHLGLALKDEGDLAGAVEQLTNATQRSASDIPSWRGLAECLEKLDRKTDAARAYLELAQACATANRTDEAVAAAANSVRLNGSDPAALRYYGDSLRVASRYEEAIAVLDRAIVIDPDDGVTWAIKGAALHGLGREEEAIAALDHALRVNPGDAWALSIKGETLIALANFVEAEPPLRQSIALNSHFAGAHALLAWALIALGRNEEALEEANTAGVLDPNDAFALSLRGNALYRLKRYEEALSAYDRATTVGARSTFAWIDKAQALEGMGRFGEALTAVDRAIEIDPVNAAATIGKAKILLGDGDAAKRKQAIELFQKALSLHPTANEAADIALGLLAAGRPEDAVTAADQALQSPRPPVSAFFSKGEALHLAGRPEAALRVIEEGLRRIPESQAAYGLGLKAQSLAATGQMVEAEAAYRKSVRIDPNLDWTWSGLSRILASSNPHESLEAADRALQLNPSDGGTLKMKAETLEALDRRAEAIDCLRRAAALDPKSAWLHLKLADLYVQTGQNEAGLKEAEEALEREPDSGSAHALRGYILHSMGDAAAAEPELRKALKLGAEAAWVYADLASLLREANRPDEALDAVRKAIALEPNNASAMEIQGQIYVAIGEFAAAVKAFDLAIARGASPHFWKGVALDNVERLDEARECYEKSLKSDPEDVWSQRALADIYLLQNRIKDGQDIFETILKKMSGQTRDPYEVGLCAWCHYGCGRLEPAIRLYGEALSLDREGALKSGPFDLGLISAAAQRYSQAVREYDRAIDLAGQAHPWIQKNLFGVAVSDLQRAMRTRFPGIASSPEVQQCLARLKSEYETASAVDTRPKVD